MLVDTGKVVSGLAWAVDKIDLASDGEAEEGTAHLCLYAAKQDQACLGRMHSLHEEDTSLFDVTKGGCTCLKQEQHCLWT